MPAPKKFNTEIQQQTWQSRKEIRELKDKSFDLNQLEQKNKKNERVKKAFGTYETSKETIHMFESQKKRDRMSILKITAENFSNVGRKMNIQIHEATNPQHAEIKMSYTKT